jgi:hypothetical protein
VENLHQLLNVRTIRLLHFISLWSRQLDKLIRHQKLSNEDKKYKRKMAKKANEDMVSLILTRERRRSSSLPESRSAVSGVELLTDQLVSSIMGEITGKSSQENLEFPGRSWIRQLLSKGFFLISIILDAKHEKNHREQPRFFYCLNPKVGYYSNFRM